MRFNQQKKKDKMRLKKKRMEGDGGTGRERRWSTHFRSYFIVWLIEIVPKIFF